jgi:hypothetical protein
MLRTKPDTGTATTAKAGEIWKTNSRKGLLTVRFMQDVDTAKDGFVDAEIINGTARYMSESNRFLQSEYGQGTPGDTITMRTTLLTLVERLEAEGSAK